MRSSRPHASSVRFRAALVSRKAELTLVYSVAGAKPSDAGSVMQLNFGTAYGSEPDDRAASWAGPVLRDGDRRDRRRRPGLTAAAHAFYRRRVDRRQDRACRAG